MAGDMDSDGDDEAVVEGSEGVEAERLGLPREDDFVRKLLDPKLPTLPLLPHHPHRYPYPQP
jgi:hypothetical protein